MFGSVLGSLLCAQACSSGDGAEQGFASFGETGQVAGTDTSAEPSEGGEAGMDAGTDAGDETGETGETGGDGAPPGRDRDDGEAPVNEYCEAVADWDPSWRAYEQEVIDRLNAARAIGASCGAAGEFPPAPPLALEPALSCAARVHAGDMAARDYFDHESPEGELPEQRLGEAGYTGAAWAENIGAGFPTPAEAVAGWMNSDLHCANVLRAEFAEIGVGYAFGPESTYAHYWTLMLGG